MTKRLLAGLAALLVMRAPGRVAAQIDYRNLDAHRPSRVEDAYALERGALEILVGYTAERDRGAAWTHILEPELTWGVVRNAHVGVRLSLAATRLPGGTATGLGGVGLFALYNLNTESLALPAASVRGEWVLPAGDLGPDVARGALQAIVTRSFGRTRVHASAAAGLGPPNAGGRHTIPRWWAGIAADRTLFRESVLLIGEAVGSGQSAGDQTALVVGAGVRWQWRPTAVLDVGVSRRVTAAGPDVAFTAGVTKVMGVPWLGP